MRPPQGVEMIGSCVDCRLRAGRPFCDLSQEALEALDSRKCPSIYPKGAILFVEGQAPGGIYLLCTGRAKLTASLANSKARIMRIAEAGEVLGLSAAVSGKDYEVTAETLDSCQVSFVRRDDFLTLLRSYGEVCLKAARHLSNDYHAAYEQVRSLMLSHSAAEKLAKLLLRWSSEFGEESPEGMKLELLLTHEEIAQMIGSSRETVTRLLGDFKIRRILSVKGPVLTILDMDSLKNIIFS